MDSIAKYFRNILIKKGIEFPTETYTPYGQIILRKPSTLFEPEDSTIVINGDFSSFFAIGTDPYQLEKSNAIKGLNIPTVYFIYCNLVDSTKKLF